MASKLKIGLLVAAHVAAGIVLALAGDVEINGFYFTRFGAAVLVLADAGLIGIWGGLGTTRIVWRVPVVLAMTSTLSAISLTALRVWNDGFKVVAVFLLVVGVMVLNLGVLSGLRHGRRGLRLALWSNGSPNCEGFQFTIQHLFVATTAVAVVLAIGRTIRTDSIGVWQTTLVVATFTPSMIMIQLATLWAALGIGRPALRLVAVVPTAFAVGLIPPFYTLEPVRSNLTVFVGLSVAFGLQATIMAASLLIVRSSGWRLVRGAAENDLADDETNAVADDQPPGT